MSGKEMRPEVSKKNEFWISKHRFYELRHFCLQYQEWKAEYDEINEYPDGYFSHTPTKSAYRNPTAVTVERKLALEKNIELVKNTALGVDEVLGPYIFESAIKGVSYEYLRMRRDIPCCRDTYYLYMRKFFYTLSKKRE